MLTKTDLRKISDVLSIALDNKLESRLSPIRKDLEKLKSVLSNIQADSIELRTDISGIKRELVETKKELKSQMRGLRVGQKEIVNLFDRDIYDHRRRLDRVESVLHLPPLAKEVFQEVEV